MSFINPTTFMQKDFGEALRKYIKSNVQVINILDFNDFQVFSSVTNYTGVFIFQKINKVDPYTFDYHRYLNNANKINYQDFSNSLTKNSKTDFKNYISVSSKYLNNSRWVFKGKELNVLLSKVSKNTKPLSEISTEIFQGIASGKDEVFYVDEKTIQQHDLEKDVLFPMLKGKDIKAYKIDWSGKYVIYPYDDNSSVISEDKVKIKYPNIYSYLVKNKQKLGGRKYFEKSSKLWYELWNQRKISNFKKRRIIVPEISRCNNFAITNRFFGNTKTYNIILKKLSINNYYYMLGVLNSNLINFYYTQLTTPHAGGFYAYKTQFLKDIPIKN